MISIRVLQADDLAAWMQTPPPPWASGTHEDAMAAVTVSAAVFPTMRLLVAEDDGEPVSFLLYSDGAWPPVYLRHFDTRPDRQRQGLTRSLVCRMLADEPRRPVSAWGKSKAGAATLVACGFRETGEGPPDTHILDE
jgi:hypothetical protein